MSCIFVQQTARTDGGCDHIRVLTPLELSLLNDQPAFQGAQSDLLGREPAIAQLADLVRRSQSAAPFTVAIYGEWGACSGLLSQALGANWGPQGSDLVS
ncbi:hypothetical protein GCM10009839_33310 [Catenulispora yoronensis]|uniref:Uncharacterized protein n=1 Tax=Catenulispora yoronensis TaxID=450799 RepID=A0ABN2U8E3_9ACTN